MPGRLACGQMSIKAGVACLLSLFSRMRDPHYGYHRTFSVGLLPLKYATLSSPLLQSLGSMTTSLLWLVLLLVSRCTMQSSPRCDPPSPSPAISTRASGLPPPAARSTPPPARTSATTSTAGSSGCPKTALTTCAGSRTAARCPSSPPPPSWGPWRDGGLHTWATNRPPTRSTP